MPPPQWGGLDLGSDNSGCARLGGSKVPPPLGVVKETFMHHTFRKAGTAGIRSRCLPGFLFLRHTSYTNLYTNPISKRLKTR